MSALIDDSYDLISKGRFHMNLNLSLSFMVVLTVINISLSMNDVFSPNSINGPTLYFTKIVKKLKLEARAMHTMFRSISLHKPCYIQNTMRESKDERMLRSMFNDPDIHLQWYLTKPNGSQLSHDVGNIWKSGITGKKITVSIIGGPVDVNHKDLKKNYNLYLSYDLLNKTKHIDSKIASAQATTIAGLVSAVSDNGICGVGIAPDSQFANLIIFYTKMHDFDEKMLTNAYLYSRLSSDIYINSWTPSKQSDYLKPPSLEAREGIRLATIYGRDSKNSLILFPAGTTKYKENNCAYNGFVQIEGTFTISSLTVNGEIPSYIQSCTAILAAALSSSDDKQFLYSTQKNNKCKASARYTSAATAIAAGIFALLLEANPDLMVRHILYLVAKTSIQYDSNAVINRAGYAYSKYIGFGLLDANALIKEAHPAKFYAFPGQNICYTRLMIELRNIQNTNPYESWFYTSGCFEHISCVANIEEVVLNFSLSVVRRNLVNIFLVSPSGTRAEVIEPRKDDESNSGFNFWVVKILSFYGESVAGLWKIEIHNLYKNSILINWKLHFYGNCVNSLKNFKIHEKVKKFMCDPDLKLKSYLFDRICNASYKIKLKSSTDFYSFSRRDYKDILRLDKVINQD